jgi:Zn-dependent protease
MLLANHDLLIDNPLGFALLLAVVGVALLLSISVHEFSHAAAAYLQGDRTAQRQGRLTLNPKAHLDPTGTLMLAIVGFGWGRPVPVDLVALRSGRIGMALVSLAGPASNVMLALVLAALFQVGVFDGERLGVNPFSNPSFATWWALLGWFGVSLNLILAVFNLLPIAPLDGSGILRGIVPRQWLGAVRRIEVYGPIVLLGVVLISLFTRWSVLRVIFDPALDLARTLAGV